MIIGIIPNKNDGWILEANLKIFSKICDKIIIGLDNCNDDSENIVKKFDNVLIIKNPNSELSPNNHNRRQALLEKARELTNNPIIIAVDVDEIFSEEILNEENLQIIKNLDYQTVLEVKFRELWFSPFLYRSEKNSVWAGRLMSCIWKDNGLDYPLNNWHEVRVPEIKKKKLLNVELVHFARVLPLKYWSRMRYYIARDIYVSKKNSIKTNFHYAVVHSQKDMILSPIKKNWFPFFSKDFFFNIQKNDTHINWFNDAVLDYLLNDNRSCLKLADIWDFDWIEYYKIRKNKEPDELIINKLKDRRNNLEKKITYYIRVNNSYPVYSIYFYINLVKIFLIKIKIYNLVRHLFFK